MPFIPSVARPASPARRARVVAAPPPTPDDPPVVTALTGTPMTDQDRPLKILGSHSFYGGPARAAGVTGGIGRPYYYVTVPGFGTGVGTIRHAISTAASDGGRYIRYAIDDPTLNMTAQIAPPVRTTIDARGFVVAWTDTTTANYMINPTANNNNWEMMGLVISDGNPSNPPQTRDVIRIYGLNETVYSGSKLFFACMKIWVQDVSDSAFDISRLGSEGADITRAFVGIDFLTTGNGRRAGIIGDGNGPYDASIRVLDHHQYIRTRQRQYYNHGRHHTHNVTRRFAMHGEQSRNNGSWYSRYDVFDATEAGSTRKSQGHIEYADIGAGGTPTWDIANQYEKGGSTLALGDGLTRGTVDPPDYDDWDPCEADEDDFLWDLSQDHAWTVTISGDLSLISFHARPARPFPASTAGFLAGLSHPLTGTLTRVSPTLITLAPTNAAAVLASGDQLWWKGVDASGNPIVTWNPMFITGGDTSGGGGATVPSVTASVGEYAAAGSVSKAIVISGDNPYLLVWATATNGADTATTATVTINGASMTLLDSQVTPSGQHFSLWGRANPTSGDIVATGGSSPTEMTLLGVALRDSGPIGIPEKVTAAAAGSISDTVVSAVDRLVIAGVHGYNTNFGPGTGMTLVRQHPESASSLYDSVAVSSIPGAASVTTAHNSSVTRDLTQISVEVRKVGEDAPMGGGASGDPALWLGGGQATGQTLDTANASKNFEVTLAGSGLSGTVPVNTVMMAHVKAIGTATITFTNDASWVLVGTLRDLNTDETFVYRRLAGASEPLLNNDFTISTNSADALSDVGGGVRIDCWQGDPTDPINIVGNTTTVNAQAQVAEGITTDANNCTLVQVISAQASNRSVEPAGTMDELYDFNGTGLQAGWTMFGATEVQATMGATGTRTATLSSGATAATLLYALNPQP